MSATYIGRLRHKIMKQAVEIRNLKMRLGEDPPLVDLNYFDGAPYVYRRTPGGAEVRCGICEVIVANGDSIKLRTPIQPSENTRIPFSGGVDGIECD